MLYAIDERDRLIALSEIPACNIGAPLPAIVAREHHTCLCYVVAKPSTDGGHGQSVTAVDHDSDDDAIAVVEFQMCADVRFGWFPDENTYHRHPLASLGLDSYSAFEVQNSSWVRQLTRLESGNRDTSLEKKRHFILTFHDSSIECVADSYTVTVQQESIRAALSRLSATL